MKKLRTLFATFLCLWIPAVFAQSFGIVYIHIGDELPEYLEVSIAQARLFNPVCPIYLVGNEQPLAKFSHKAAALNTTLVTCESLAKTPQHLHFLRNSKLDKTSRKGFWLYTTERLFYLHEFMLRSGLEHVFHLENDNMLYMDLAEYLHIFSSNYPGIAATFDNEIRCIAGFMYIHDKNALKLLTDYLAENASKGTNEMELIARFKLASGSNTIDHLPIIPSEYLHAHSLRVIHHRPNHQPYRYCHLSDQFGAIFDAAALGQYLGGIDPRNGPSMPGFINESCVFDPSLLFYEWMVDHAGRKVPYVNAGGRLYRINNLHIHSKKLHEFYSNR